MNDTKFNALVRLLDDDDPRVAEQVEQELIGLGSDGILRLEQAWETIGDEQLQSRIEDLIARIQIGTYTAELMTWRQGGGRDLLEGWILLSQFRYPTLNVQKYRNEINRLVNKIWLQLNSRMNDLEKLCIINRQLYSVSHFTGAFNDPERPENNFISEMIDTGRGNSLSLSAFYYLICQQLEIPLQVVNFNGYFALRYYDKRSHFYIDAYNKGMFFTPQQVQQFLRKLNMDDNMQHYKSMTHIYIILYLIEHLIANYEAAGHLDKAEQFRQLKRDIDIRFE